MISVPKETGMLGKRKNMLEEKNLLSSIRHWVRKGWKEQNQKIISLRIGQKNIEKNTPTKKLLCIIIKENKAKQF